MCHRSGAGLAGEYGGFFAGGVFMMCKRRDTAPHLSGITMINSIACILNPYRIVIQLMGMHISFATALSASPQTDGNHIEIE